MDKWPWYAWAILGGFGFLIVLTVCLTALKMRVKRVKAGKDGTEVVMEDDEVPPEEAERARARIVLQPEERQGIAQDIVAVILPALQGGLSHECVRTDTLRAMARMFSPLAENSLAAGMAIKTGKANGRLDISMARLEDAAQEWDDRVQNGIVV